jgi:chemotaxis protein CheD
MAGEDSVEVASYTVSGKPSRLRCLGLGSCLGIILHDPTMRLGGLAHAMLPLFSEGRNRRNPARFVDASIYLMVDELIDLGVKKHRLRAKLVGGSEMFSHVGSNTLDVGRRNIEAGRETLKREKITIVAEDVGGSSGRSITFDIGTGKVTVRKTGQGETVI